MADRQSASVQAHVRAQFDRQVAHYLPGSAMADQELLECIVRLVRPAPGMRVLDMACGAGFLAWALARGTRQVVGVDLSQRMLTEAHTLTHTVGLGHTAFIRADAEALPFAPHTFDLVTCKLAFHYFPHPQVALAQMVRKEESLPC